MEQELEIARRIASNDKVAFRELFDKYQSEVLKLCYAMIRDKDDAEDITQEVFVEVFCSIGSYKGKSKLSTWIYRIAVNKSINFMSFYIFKTILKSINFIRKQKIRRLFATKEKRTTDNSTNVGSDWTLRDRQYKEYLDKALSNLPEKQRTAFVLYMYEELPQKEIAAIMNCSISVVEVSIHRARKSIEKYIQSFDKELLT